MENYMYGGFVVGALFAHCYRRGYLQGISGWFSHKYSKVKFLMTLLKNIESPDSNEDLSSVSFSVNDTGESASILYSRLGQRYIVIVPYRREYIAQMSQFKVELLHEKGDPVDITQQPGIPYMIDANALGGKSIRITNYETGNSKEYPRGTVPMYGTEVMES